MKLLSKAPLLPNLPVILSSFTPQFFIWRKSPLACFSHLVKTPIGDEYAQDSYNETLRELNEDGEGDEFAVFDKVRDPHEHKRKKGVMRFVVSDNKADQIGDG